MNGYVEAGYVVVLTSLAAYAAWVSRRHRVLSRSVPPGQPNSPGPGGEGRS